MTLKENTAQLKISVHFKMSLGFEAYRFNTPNNFCFIFFFFYSHGICFPSQTASHFSWMETAVFCLIIVIYEVVRGANKHTLIKLLSEIEYLGD